MSKIHLALVFLSFVLVIGCQVGNRKATELKNKSMVLGTSDCCDKGPLNQLTEAEKAQGWILLFDGTSATGWRGYNKDHFPASWMVDQGTLHCQAEESREENGKIDGGDLVFDQPFGDFDLRLEWKIAEGGNSGVFYRATEVPGWPIYKSAPELQIVDNDRVADAKLGIKGNRMSGSLYDVFAANPQNAKKAGEWNSVEIICYDGKVVHRQNGVVVLQYEFGSESFRVAVKQSKFPGLNPDWGNFARQGLIGLQDRGTDVWFRNLKIRKLESSGSL